MLKIGKNEQLQTLHRALELVTQFGCVVDGGAATGDWANIMAGKFATVYAFEPHPKAFEILQRRVASNVMCHNEALSDKVELVHLTHVHPGSPKWRGAYIQPGGDLPAVTIDSLSLTNCGLIKLDVEGAEMAAIAGARKTLKRCKPVVIVECKPGYPELFGATVEQPGQYLARLGAREAFRFGPDRVYQW